MADDVGDIGVADSTPDVSSGEKGSNPLYHSATLGDFMTHNQLVWIHEELVVGSGPIDSYFAYFDDNTVGTIVECTNFCNYCLCWVRNKDKKPCELEYYDIYRIIGGLSIDKIEAKHSCLYDYNLWVRIRKDWDLKDFPQQRLFKKQKEFEISVHRTEPNSFLPQFIRNLHIYNEANPKGIGIIEYFDYLMEALTRSVPNSI